MKKGTIDGSGTILNAKRLQVEILDLIYKRRCRGFCLDQTRA